MTPDQIAKAISEVALLRGEFTLRSGRKSSFYLDKYLFSTQPDVLRSLAKLFTKRIHMLELHMKVKANRLAGAELGGIPLVTAASMESGLPCLFVRGQKKEYGTAKRLEGKMNVGDKVIIIEDVATTGGAALDAAAALKAEGAIVLAIIATIDRQEGARENVEQTGIHFESLFTKADLGITE